MILLLDTTYFLPAVGIRVRGVPQAFAAGVRGAGHEVAICDVTLFELAAKGAKYVAKGALPAWRVQRGIRSLLSNELVRIPFHDDAVLGLALELRALVPDFIDCLVLSAAVNYCDALVTEDEDLLGLRGSEDFKRAVGSRAKPGFRVVNSYWAAEHLLEQ